MDLQTKIKLNPQTELAINYEAKVLLLGSCFTENIGKKLAYYKFENTINPYGILFHPWGIKNCIKKALNNYHFTEKDLVFHNNKYHSLDTHSLLSSSRIEETLQNLNEANNITNSSIKNASHIIITLGTSWVYRYLENQKIVSNCHKIPQKKFQKELLSIAIIKKSLQETVQQIQSVNTNVKIIFTVSPIRHLKDGFVENTRSKAHLLAAIHECIEGLKNTFYFPSYEIQMDELRDYRFYKEDMIHPNKTAINYIWEKFKECWISKDAYATMHKVETIQKGLQHKPFDEKSEAHTKFLEKLQTQQDALIKQFPHIKF